MNIISPVILQCHLFSYLIVAVTCVWLAVEVDGQRTMYSYSGRASMAHVVYQRMITDERHRSDDHNYWYAVDVGRLPDEICSKFMQCHQDSETGNFLENCYKKADWVFVQIAHSLAKSLLGWFMTNTSINGYLGRGSMFVFSQSQISQLLSIPSGWLQDNLLDLGAGDGMVTEKLARYFRHVYTTEASHTMIRRLHHKGYHVLEMDSWGDGAITYDLVSCLNLLDRCDKPVSILHAIRRTLRPGTGRLLVAVVLPFEPYVEFGASNHKPTERILVRGHSFEEQASSLVTDVFTPAGFSLEKFTKLPYLCEGDMQNSFYVLHDAVFVLKVTEPG